MIPLFIPYVNRPDLLEKALASVGRVNDVQTLVLNNSGTPLNVLYQREPPVPLTFAQTQNWMLKMAEELNAPFYLFMHSDAEAVGDTVLRLVSMAKALTVQGKRWGTIFTNYDALAAFNTEAMRAIGGWDTMLEWYHSDIDTYYRLRLAGYELIESGLPVKHEPSQTLKADPLLKLKIDLMAPCRSEYYRRKWGGEAHHEVYERPFNVTE